MGEEESSAKRPGHSPRILVVDDEPGVTAALKMGLERRGFSVGTYNNPLVALSEFTPGTYQVSILDIRMPQMTGFELCRRLKKLDPAIRICFLTAFDVYQKEFETMFPDVKADALFRKPVTLNDLVTKLQRVLAGPQTPRVDAGPVGGS